MTMVVDYVTHQYAASTMSLETSSGSCGSRASRVRTIRLVRPSHGTLPPPSFTCRHGPSLGFSLRGGREHGTGFFVSHVEPASEAHRQGLKVGDQIIRVNGFTVEDAVHKEVLQLISNHTHLTLKVRRVGMIPVKEKKSDALSWQIITDNNSMRLSPFLEKIHDVRMTVTVSPRSKLGCGICKGPEWKPGIFVQFTKDGGIAREAGLRPGDQILMCNNVDFSDIPFSEAVNIMKMSRQLELIVRKGAGSELFPGESSGYNSSASSVTGDQSPSWSDSKRLSIVKEENLDLEDRLDRLKCTSQWNNIEWDEQEELDKPYFKPTIINLTENATFISNNGSDECQVIENDYGTIGRQKQELVSNDTHKIKTIVADVHRSDVEELSSGPENGLVSSTNSSFNLGEASSRNSIASCSLSSALSMEIHRRNEKKKLATKPSIDEQLQMKKTLQGVNSDQQSQHSKLMDEFKKAHKRMFKSSDECNDDYSEYIVDRNSSTDISQNFTERILNVQDTSTSTKRKNSSLSRHTSCNSNASLPPPPPPLPLAEPSSATPTTNGAPCNTLKSNKTQKPRAPPVPEKRSISSFSQPPPCPTPDYDTVSVASSMSIPKHNGFHRNLHTETVEMESLESFELYSPVGNRPRHPDIYFSNTSSMNGSISSGTSTLRKKRPVSVTIGEYGNGTLRKPGKLDFLQNCNDEVDKRGSQTITSQFASELAQTLNRSNLKRRTESMENLLNCPQIKPQTNGSVRISLSNMPKTFAKSTNDISSSRKNISEMFANRVTININNSVEGKNDNKNGILKNSTVDNIPTHRPLVAQKSITFRELPIVINDKSSQVTT